MSLKIYRVMIILIFLKAQQQTTVLWFNCIFDFVFFLCVLNVKMIV